MVSTLTGLDLTKQENILLFEYTETSESEPDKLDVGPVLTEFRIDRMAFG